MFAGRSLTLVSRTAMELVCRPGVLLLRNESETPSSVITRAVLLVYSTGIALTNSDGTPYFLSISNIVSLLMPSNERLSEVYEIHHDW